MRKHLINLFLLFLVGAAAALVWVETRDAPPEPLIAKPTSDIQRTGFMRGARGAARLSVCPGAPALVAQGCFSSDCKHALAFRQAHVAA